MQNYFKCKNSLNHDKNQNANNFNINSVKINEEPEDELININKKSKKEILQQYFPNYFNYCVTNNIFTL